MSRIPSIRGRFARQAKAIFLAVSLLCGGATIVKAADSNGNIDTTWQGGGLFDTAVFNPTNAYGSKVVSLANDKTLHLARLTSGSNGVGYGLFQLTSAGALDTSFSTDGWLKQGLTAGSVTMNDISVTDLHVLSDGSILVTGSYYNNTSNPAQFGLFAAKYDSSGTPDATYGTNGISFADYYALSGQGNWTAFTPVISVSSSGRVYGYYPQNGNYIVRLNVNGSIDTTFGTGGWYLGLYSQSAPFSGASISVGAFTVDEAASPQTATFYGVNQASSPTLSSAVMYRLKFGSHRQGPVDIADLDTSFSGTSVVGGTASSTSGYSRVEIPATGMALGKAVVGPNGFVYITAGANYSTSHYLIAMDASQRTPFRSFGTDGVLSISASAITNLRTMSVSGSGTDKIFIGGEDTNNKFVVAKFNLIGGGFENAFGTNGVSTLTACSAFHTMAGLVQASNGAVVISGTTFTTVNGVNTQSPRIARLGSGSTTTQCGTTTTASTMPQQNNNNNQNNNNQNNVYVPLTTPVGTAVEVPGEGIRVTVNNLAAGAHIAVLVFDSANPPGNSSADIPWFTEGATGVTTLMVNSIPWSASVNGMGTGVIARSTPLVAGVSYRVSVRQQIGTLNSMSSQLSAYLTSFMTLTANVAATSSTSTSTTTTTTTVPKAAAVAVAAAPGVMVTDTKVYVSETPKKVAAESAITVMTPAQAKVQEIVSMTPAVCLPNDDDIVFIDTGKCIAKFINEKTGKVLRSLVTTVVADEVSELNVGNEIAILAPIYFEGGSSTVTSAGLARIKSIKDKVTAAGSVLLVGHSGILMGNTPENVAMAKARATSTAKALKSVGAKGPFYATSAGALDPASNKKTVAAQAKNRRVVIVLVP